MIDWVAPPYSSRRLAMRLTREALLRPSTLQKRLNRRNVVHWREARAAVVTCNICGHRGHLLDEMLDLESCEAMAILPERETLRCRSCGSTMRDRVVAGVLLDAMLERGVIAATIEVLAEVMPMDFRVLATGPNGRIADRMCIHPGYFRHCMVEPSATAPVEELPFPDEYFDVVISSDVMQHVQDVGLAHHEISRCLKDDGDYILTVPYDESLPSTRELEHTTDPVPTYRVFGRDLVDELATAGLEARFISVDRPDIGVLMGDVFRARPDTHEPDGRALPRHGGTRAVGGRARPSNAPLIA